MYLKNLLLSVLAIVIAITGVISASAGEYEQRVDKYKDSVRQFNLSVDDKNRLVDDKWRLLAEKERELQAAQQQLQQQQTAPPAGEFASVPEAPLVPRTFYVPDGYYRGCVEVTGLFPPGWGGYAGWYTYPVYGWPVVGRARSSFQNNVVTINNITMENNRVDRSRVFNTINQSITNNVKTGNNSPVAIANAQAANQRVCQPRNFQPQQQFQPSANRHQPSMVGPSVRPVPVPMASQQVRPQYRPQFHGQAQPQYQQHVPAPRRW